jgi:MFS family permease
LAETAPSKATKPPRDLWILCATFFFIFLGGGALQQHLNTILAKTRGWDGLMISSVLATVYGTFAVWRLFIGYSMRLLGRRMSIFLGTLTYALLPFAIQYFHFPGGLHLAAVVWGWGAASAWITSSTQILDLTETHQYGKASGTFYSAVFVGQGLGVLILHRLGEADGWSGRPITWALQYALWITVLGAVISLWVSEPKIEVEIPPLRELLLLPFAPKARILGLYSVASSIGFGILLGSLSSHINATYGAQAVAPIVMSFYIGRLVFSYVAGRLTDRFGAVAVLVGTFLLSAVGFLAPVLAEGPVTLATSALAMGLMQGNVPVASMRIVGDSAQKGRRHLAFGAIYVWRDLGVVAGLLGGEAFRDFRLSLIVFAVLFVACGALSPALARRAQERF